MTEDTNIKKGESEGVNKKKSIIISLVILIMGAVVTFVIFRTEPTAKRQGATKETAMLVEVISADKGSYRPLISVTGTVIPSRDVILSPRVGGEIIRRSRVFTPGGFVNKGELLLKIDPADYQNALRARMSELHQAQADLQIEMGRQDVAKQDYALIDENLAEENKSLVLREPQLNAVKARIEAAETAVEQAELDLQRTNIRAPFDALIINREVNVGSQVSAGENLGRLVGIDEYWIETTVPQSLIRWLDFPDQLEEKGSTVKIRNRTAWEKNQYRIGNLYQLIGTLEGETRMARVLVKVSDPLARDIDTGDVPRLMIGAFVEANIMADTLKDVVRLSRDYIRQDETVWVMENNKLKIKKVGILFRDPKYVYIKDGISQGDKIVTTNLTTIVEGAALRTGEDSPEKDANQQIKESSQ